MPSIALEQDDAVAVGAGAVVGDAPAVGGFGEVLLVDHDAEGMERKPAGGGDDALFQFDEAVAHLADFEGDGAAGLCDAGQLDQCFADECLPVGHLAMAGDVDGLGIDSEEPAAQPVIPLVIDDVEEGGRGHGELNAGVGYVGSVVGLGGADEGFLALRALLG